MKKFIITVECEDGSYDEESKDENIKALREEILEGPGVIACSIEIEEGEK